MAKKEVYDLIISLGGNCAAASQLVYRDIRRFSLPFDYTFMSDVQPIKYLCEGLKNHFNNLLLRENIEELKGKERGDEREVWQYKDTYSGYRFIHLFGDDINKEGVYDKGIAIIRKRIDRLYQKLDKAKKILVILETSFVFDEKYILDIKKTFEELYPEKKFVFYIIMLNAEKYEEKSYDNITCVYSLRDVNMYDFEHTNWEWSFLDKITLTEIENEKKKLLLFKKIKRGIGICLFPFLPTLFRFKVYLLRIKLDFCLGKMRSKF